MNIDTTALVIGLVGVVAFGGLLFWLIPMVWRGRIMRCPETGAVSVVQVALAARGDEKVPGLRVTQCDSWPQKKIALKDASSAMGKPHLDGGSI